MKTLTMEKAAEIWSYMSVVKSCGKSDAIVICCSYDLRVYDHACQLIHDGYSKKLVISGKSGSWTQHLWSETEAQVFYERAIANGINENQILLEPNATNFGENIMFSKALIPNAKTVIFVSKPNSLLRVKLVVKELWPEISVYVSCPDIHFPDQVSNIIGVWGVINEMVGDIDRIQVYPKLGYQAEHPLPEKILENWHYLMEHGFTHHLLPKL